MDTVFIFCLIFLYVYLFLNFFRVPSHQLLIQLWGFNKIPKLILELANVDKEGNATWQSLDKLEEKRVIECHEKLEAVA